MSGSYFHLFHVIHFRIISSLSGSLGTSSLLSEGGVEDSDRDGGWRDVSDGQSLLETTLPWQAAARLRVT